MKLQRYNLHHELVRVNEHHVNQYSAVLSKFDQFKLNKAKRTHRPTYGFVKTDLARNSLLNS